MNTEQPFATVVKRKDLADGLWIQWFNPSIEISFKPGQYITIGKDGSSRPYSIVSAPHEKQIELFLEIVPPEFRTEKSLSPKLFKLKDGDRVNFRPNAKGKMILDPNKEIHVLISTVTGVAPFISMIRAYLNSYYGKKFTFYIFQGASYSDEFGYLEEIQQAADASDDITYVPTVSRPNKDRNKSWNGQTGRVNMILDAYFKKYNIQPNEKTKVYLCGNRGMIETLGNKREKPGKPLGKLVKNGFEVIEEIFF